MVLLCGVAQVESHFCAFRDMLILTQDRYTVCPEHVIGSEIILGTPDGTPRYHGLSEAHFGLFGDSVNVVSR
jgi:hypothetical protein